MTENKTPASFVAVKSNVASVIFLSVEWIIALRTINTWGDDSRHVSLAEVDYKNLWDIEIHGTNVVACGIPNLIYLLYIIFISIII